LPQRVAQFFNDIGIKLLEGYGLTESAPVLSVARPDEPLKPGSVGKPLGKVELKLAGASGQHHLATANAKPIKSAKSWRAGPT
jgi:long-subunit acyl-CoA synthetase (AMP-forming)